MKVLIAGGGTGGHIYPGVAIANQIKYEHSDWEVEFAGRSDCIEGEVVPNAGYKLHNIRIYGFERYYSKLEKAKVFLKMFKGYLDAKKLIKEYKPDIVIGTGGFVSGPVVLAAAKSKVKTLIHEQNAVPGFTTKTLSKWADTVCSSFPNTNEFVKYPDRVVYVGNPVRREFGLYTREIARKTLNINNDKIVIVSFGGSLGAKKINDSMMEIINKFKNDELVEIFHITGRGAYREFLDELKENNIDLEKINNIKIMDYTHDMPILLNGSDIVIARSGAMSIAEITLLGLVGIYVPYPLAADDHQRKNALEIVNKNAGFMILDKDLDGQVLYEHIINLVKDNNLLGIMSENSKKLSNPNSSKMIVKEVQKLIC